MARVAFVGLGTMGYPMAGHLARAGHDVAVFNRTTATAERWLAEHRGHVAGTPAQAAASCDAVFVCVGNDDDVRSVVYGAHGALSAMQPGSILVDHTTASADLAGELSAASETRGVGFVDAPVSGGQAGAENGQLSIMCGGALQHYALVEPIMAAYAKASALIGPSGHGQLTKMVNQIAIAGLVQALSEALNFGDRAGLDMSKVLSVISQGAASSWQMQNRAVTMLDDRFDFGFAVEWMRKDLGICLAEAHRLGALLPITEQVDQFYAELVDRGGARWDTSSLIRRLR